MCAVIACMRYAIASKGKKQQNFMFLHNSPASVMKKTETIRIDRYVLVQHVSEQLELRLQAQGKR